MSLREYAGAAKSTTLVGDITAGSAVITVADATGYPTGATGPFAIALALGDAEEEKILILNRSGNTMNVHTRGYDGTTASAHSSGTTIDHVLTAVDVREANEHVNDSTGDPHPQYLTEAEGIQAYAPIGAKGVRAHRSTNQSIPNTTSTAVQWDAEGFDTSGFHDNATNNTRLTVPAGEGGRYLVAGVISMFGTLGTYREALIRVSGTHVGTTNLAPAEFGRFPFAFAVTLVAGDFVEVFVAQNSGGALDVRSGAAESFVTLMKIGA
jgi:hypothetical protein